MIATLQGLAANNSSSQIYIITSLEPDYNIWLEDLKNSYGIDYKIIDDPWKLVDIFKPYVSGYILYSKAKTGDPTINNATSLASVKHCIAVDESIESKVISHGITNLKGDCRNTDKYWAYNNLWPELNHSVVIQLSTDKDIPLRDYAVMTKSLVFYEPDPYDISLRDKVFSSMDFGSTVLGWGPDEFINVSTASKYGISIVPADWSYNLTVLSSFPSCPTSQKSHPIIPAEDDVHYVTFMMSDGDNQQWYLGSNFSSPKWYGSPYRGSFNMGWTISPSLYYLAPTVFNMYYKTAINTDNFSVSPSGSGYMYPSRFPPEALNIFVQRLNEYMKNVDQKYASILDDDAFYKTGVWDKYTKQPNIEGLFYLNYKRQDDYHGRIIWSNGKPVVSCRDLLWSNLEDEDMLVKNINKRISSGQTDVKTQNAYTFVYVHAWSKDMGSIQNCVGRLKQNPKVRVVTPEMFMALIKMNVKGTVSKTLP